MVVLRQLQPHIVRSLWESIRSQRWRSLHHSRGGSNGKKRVPRSQPQRLSLLEELFPGDGYKNKLSSEVKDQELPRLPLPELDEFFEEVPDDLGRNRDRPSKVTQSAAAHAFRHQKLAVLVLQTASKSLIESDFRRVAPKGKHIDDWTGPGDILRGKPAELCSTNF